MNRARSSCIVVLTAAFIVLSGRGQATISSGEPIVSSGGNYSVEGTLGTVKFSSVAGGAYSLEGGSFSPILIVETPGAPTMKIQQQGPDIVVTWSAPIDAFKLEQTAGLGGAWAPLPAVQQSAGGEVKVTIPVGSQNQFLRLKTASP